MKDLLIPNLLYHSSSCANSLKSSWPQTCFCGGDRLFCLSMELTVAVVATETRPGRGDHIAVAVVIGSLVLERRTGAWQKRCFRICWPTWIGLSRRRFLLLPYLEQLLMLSSLSAMLRAPISLFKHCYSVPIHVYVWFSMAHSQWMVSWRVRLAVKCIPGTVVDGILPWGGSLRIANQQL